jgi:hypothetical protein
MADAEEQTVGQQIVATELLIMSKEVEVQNAVENPQLHLALTQQVASLRQEKVLLMQQACAVGHSVNVPSSLYQLLIKQACSNHGKQHFISRQQNCCMHPPVCTTCSACTTALCGVD